jgi:hypothetical protein
MPMQRIAALAVLLVHLFASVATGLVYWCQMSGQVGLSSCCCQHQRAGNDGHTDEISALGCCDVSQVDANRVPTLAEKRGSERLADGLAAVVVTAPSAAPGLSLRQDRALALPHIDPWPPDGPPLYLTTRSLLL